MFCLFCIFSVFLIFSDEWFSFLFDYFVCILFWNYVLFFCWFVVCVCILGVVGVWYFDFCCDGLNFVVVRSVLFMEGLIDCENCCFRFE